MPATPLVNTAGASNANAYCDVAFADQYDLDRPSANTLWAGAAADDRLAAILWATVLLDSLVDWTGWVVTEDQGLLWPRNSMDYRNGFPVPSTIIPIELERACAEYSRQLLDGDLAGDSDIEVQGITELKAGPVTLKFSEDVVAKQVPDAVFLLLPEEWGAVRGRRNSTMELMRA